jgi:hypothetical protein
MALFERVLFGDGRQWVCAQATGEVLEAAEGYQAMDERRAIKTLLRP